MLEVTTGMFVSGSTIPRSEILAPDKAPAVATARLPPSALVTGALAVIRTCTEFETALLVSGANERKFVQSKPLVDTWKLLSLVGATASVTLLDRLRPVTAKSAGAEK